MLTLACTCLCLELCRVTWPLWADFLFCSPPRRIEEGVREMYAKALLVACISRHWVCRNYWSLCEALCQLWGNSEVAKTEVPVLTGRQSVLSRGNSRRRAVDLEPCKSFGCLANWCSSVPNFNITVSGNSKLMGCLKHTWRVVFHLILAKNPVRQTGITLPTL